VLVFNLSVDFELGWGELNRLAYDDLFLRRVMDGRLQTPAVLEELGRAGVPSTWGVVGSCCCGSFEELQAAAPAAFQTLEPQIRSLMARRPDYRDALFSRDLVSLISQAPRIELASHGFMHLLPSGLRSGVLNEDVRASARVLHELCGKPVESFIPPQNYHWPDSAFAGSTIRYVRHTPNVLSFPYSDPRLAAKFARLWNDLLRPVRHGGTGALLLFLRIDRGQRLWSAQLALIRRLLSSAEGSLYCFTHPHNLDTPPVLRRFAQFCEVVAEAQSHGRITFGRFLRQVPGSAASLATG